MGGAYKLPLFFGGYCVTALRTRQLDKQVWENSMVKEVIIWIIETIESQGVSDTAIMPIYRSTQYEHY